MNLFEKYEQLKKTDELISIGSVWSSEFYRWKVQFLDNELVYVKCIESRLGGPLNFPLRHTMSYSKEIFKEYFTRVK
jgi:hypothetical protein